MYEALNLWANCETVLGNKEKADYYAAIAARLKTAFNKPIEQGGFWSQTKKQYVYWRDKDGSVHGNNLVTPVNFAAIALGICNDPQRIAQVLDQIEARTAKENLFHWPLVFDSFKKDEVSAGNWPFPKYENGDIFPSWGYLGVRAYAGYNRNIALKYIHKLLNQYKKDGLSSQRYSRVTQLGLGDDILAGISTSITALYRDIYGLRPKWNRFGIEPKMTTELNGTQFSYTLRGMVYRIKLSIDNYAVSGRGFSVASKQAFGVNKTDKTLTFYPGNQDTMKLLVKSATNRNININVNAWTNDSKSWVVTSADDYQFTIKGLQPKSAYQVWINSVLHVINANLEGDIVLKKHCTTATTFKVKKPLN
jgi:hypothetical protein